jgi:DNA glycosylase AlkZ-like
LTASLVAQRCAAQMLSGQPANGPVAVVRHLLAIQGQDPRGVRLAIRARSAGLRAADVDRALTADRSLLITWLNRGTLHLIRSEDYWLLQQLTVRTQYLRACFRHAAAGGVSAQDAEKAVGVITDALASEGPLTRPQLGERIARAGIQATDMAPLHLIMLSCLRGLAVRGPVIGAQHAYVLVRDWVGPRPALDHDKALAELARRYLAGHGPATDRDLAKWAGLPVGQARRGLSGIASQLRERPDGLAELADTPGADDVELPVPKLLGSYDPVLLGWESRAAILGPYQQIVTVNGLFRPFALVGGRAAGMWSWTAGQVKLEAFGALAEETRAALAAEARDVQRFLGGEPDLQAG